MHSKSLVPNWVSSNEISTPRFRIARDTSPLLTEEPMRNVGPAIADVSKTTLEELLVATIH